MLKKIASNTIAQIFSKASTAIISIFLLSILTNYLSIELFWLYNKVYNFLSIFAFLADLWLYTITVREISKDKENQSKIIGNILSLRLILGIGIIFLAGFMAALLPWYNSGIALFAIFITAIFTVFSLINSAILALMQANMKIEFNLVSTTIGKLITLWGIWLIAYVFFPPHPHQDIFLPFLSIMFVWMIWIAVNTLMNYLYAKRYFQFRFLWDVQYIKHILKISLPYGIALFLSVVYFKIDIILLSLLEPKKMADVSVALYSLPMKIVEVLMILWGFYLNSILPSLSSFFHKKQMNEAKKLLSFSFRILFVLGMMFFTLWVLLRKPIIHVIANPNYLSPNLRFDSADAMIIVLWVVVFYFISNLFNYILIASENQSKLLQINIIVTLVNIIGNIIAIPYLSFIGSGIVTILSQITLFWLGFYHSRKIIQFSFWWGFIALNLVISCLVFLIWKYLLNILGFLPMIIQIVVVWSLLSWVYAGFVLLYFLAQKRGYIKPLG